jgi:hypothetical protein
VTLVFWAALEDVESPARIAAPLSGRHELAAVEATPERNRLREIPLESRMICPSFLQSVDSDCQCEVLSRTADQENGRALQTASGRRNVRHQFFATE